MNGSSPLGHNNNSDVQLNESYSSLSCHSLVKRNRLPSVTTRRALFGIPNERETDMWLDKLVNEYLEDKAKDWCFDFVNNKPLEPTTSSGSVEYECLNSDDVPQFYHSNIEDNVCASDSNLSGNAYASTNHLKPEMFLVPLSPKKLTMPRSRDPDCDNEKKPSHSEKRKTSTSPRKSAIRTRHACAALQSSLSKPASEKKPTSRKMLRTPD